MKKVLPVSIAFGFILCCIQLSFGQCEITTLGLTDVICNDNGTPLDSLDDYIQFTLTPQGNNVSSFYGVTVSNGALDWNSGQFGIPKTFSMQAGSAGNGDVVITISDMLEPTCTSDTLMTDTGHCSSFCEIMSIQMTNIACNDNGSPSVISDDFLSFSIDPQGTMIDAGYWINVSPGTVNPIDGVYGSPVSCIMQSGSAGGGDVLVSIVDKGDPSCFLDTILVDPGHCSTLCEMSFMQMDSIQCNNNGTPSIPSDDFVTFVLNPTGTNLSGAYLVSSSQGSVSPTMGVYGSPSVFQMEDGSAGGIDVLISVIDTADSNCLLDTILINPGNCSPDCEIFNEVLSNISCFDNDTDSTGLDDILSFSLSPFGSNISGSYTITVSPGVVSPTTGNFDSLTDFVMQAGSAGGGDVSVTITDSNDPSCTFNFMVDDPGSCSSLCEILDVQLANVNCNNSGTDDNPYDDFISFSLDPIGVDLNGIYSVSSTEYLVTPGTAAYDTIQYFILEGGSAGTGDVDMLAADTTYTTCFFNFIIEDPGSCSPECKIVTANLNSIQCNDNGTPSNYTDDFISFDMTPTGNNLGANYSVIVSSGTISPTTGIFGQTQTFQLQNGSAGGGDVIVKIKDISDESCPLDVDIIDPGNCSPACEIIDEQISAVICNNNGTASDYTDDYLTFSLEAIGYNVDSLYLIEVSSGSVAPDTGIFGTKIDFALQAGSAGSGDVQITLKNIHDTLCYKVFTLYDLGTCSPICEITDAQIDNIICHDNGTVSDTIDDYLTFDLSPIGFNVDSVYELILISGNVSPDSGFYGQIGAFQLDEGTAGAEDIELEIRDVLDPTCSLTINIENPGYCSDVCLIQDANLKDVVCHDNNTTSDASDDYLTFSLEPFGGNLGSNYSISSSIGSIEPSIGSYNAKTFFELSAGTAGLDDIELLMTDQVDSNCTFIITIENPGTCSPDCEIYELDIVEVKCFDNQTNADATDDRIQLSIQAFGFNAGETYNIEVNNSEVSPSFGNFGSTGTFTLDAGTAGAGDRQVSINSESDTLCTFNFLIQDPGTCSSNCVISGITTTFIECDDNNTSSDISDDFIRFEIIADGFNTGDSYMISANNGNIFPSFGAFGNTDVFQLFNGSAGAGDLTITIISEEDPSCSFSFILEDPGDCSPDCEIIEGQLSEVQCEDNNTEGDPTDDFIQFVLEPFGNNVSDSFNISSLNGEVSPNYGLFGSYGIYQLAPGSAGAGNTLVTLHDFEDEFCDKNIIITDPGSCSEKCQINDVELSVIDCDDNDTPTDSLDDRISFIIDLEGFNLTGEYLIFALNGIVSPSSGTYGEIGSFKLHEGSAGNGNFTVKIIDMEDNDCEFTLEVEDPGTCSDASSIANIDPFRHVRFFPNPMHEDLHISDIPSEVVLEVRNIFGELILSSVLDSGDQTINLQSFEAGMYFFSLSNAKQQMHTQRIIKR